MSFFPPIESGFDDPAVTKPRFYVLPIETTADAEIIFNCLTFEKLGFYVEPVEAREPYWRFWLTPEALPWLERTGQLYNPHY